MEKKNIFQKILDFADVTIENQIYKAKNTLKYAMEDDFVSGKAMTEDHEQFLGKQGYQEKPGAITYDHQKMMTVRSSPVAAVIRTYQNKVAAFSDISQSSSQKGFKIVLKDENKALEDLKLEIFGEDFDKAESPEGPEGDFNPEEASSLEPDQVPQEESLADEILALPEREQELKLKEILEKKTAQKKQEIADFIRNCGELENRPFKTKKWNFDAYLRAITYDTLGYDQIATEIVPKRGQPDVDKVAIHHFYPIDGSTIRFASPSLKTLKDPGADFFQEQNILFPEETLGKEQNLKKIELDPQKLEDEEYKYVQIIRGKIERAFTEKELAFGVRNPVTDIYMNGYAISELEVLISLVSNHLQTEYYNKAYFQQGFSAKGFIHIKANLNRKKLGEVRQHWKHLVSGNRNSFQTPIFSGMDEITWNPLSQSHSDIEFSKWMNYLIKMICAIYQIDPMEIGYGMKDEGGGSSLSGDNSEEKAQMSKNKGFLPLMRFLGEYINKNVVDNLDPDYKLVWVGLEEETSQDRIDLQTKQGNLYKSINELRAEEGLPPIPGCWEFIPTQVYLSFYEKFHPEGRKLAEEQAQQQQSQFDYENPEEEDSSQGDFEAQEAQAENNHQRELEQKQLDHEQAKDLESHKADLAQKQEKVEKSIRIETYRLD